MAGARSGRLVNCTKTRWAPAAVAAARARRGLPPAPPVGMPTRLSLAAGARRGVLAAAAAVEEAAPTGAPPGG